MKLGPALLGAALAPFFGAAPSHALEAQVRLGFDGVVLADAWAPLEVRCRLEADEAPFRGRVVLDRPGQAVSALTAPLQVAPGEEGRALLAVPVVPGRAYTVRLVDAEGETRAEAAPPPLWTVLEGGDRLVLHLGARGLRSLRARDDLPRVARVDPEAALLGSRVLAGIDAVFLEATSGSAARELAEDAEASEALRRYAAAGGTLVFLGADGPFWRDAPLARLAPVVHCAGLAPADAADVAPLLGRLPATAGRLPVREARLHPDARALAVTENGLPLVAERPLGRGRAVYVAFDLDHAAVRGAERTAGLLRELTRPRAPPPPRLRAEDLARCAEEAFGAAPALGALGFWILVAAVVAHVLLLGPLTALAARRWGPWAGLLTPPLGSLAVAALLLAVGVAWRGAPSARLLLFAFHGAGGGGPRTAAVQLEVGLYAGDGAAFRVDVPRGLAPIPRPRSELEMFQLRARSPALDFQGGRPASLGPLVVPSRGHTSVGLSGTLAPPAERAAAAARWLGPPVAVRVADPSVPAGAEGPAWPVVEVRRRSPMEPGGEGASPPNDPPSARGSGAEPARGAEGAWTAVCVGTQEIRLGALRPPRPGEPVRWDAAEGRAPSAVSGEASDPFAGRPGRRAWVARLARLLGDARRRAQSAAAPGQPVRFPAVWVIHLERRPLPLAVRADGRPLREVTAARASLYPAGDPR